MTAHAIEVRDGTPAETRRPRRKALVILAILAALSVVAWQAAVRWPRSSSGPAYSTATVKRGDVRQQVTASGTLSPLVQVEVGSQVSGRVKALHVDFNDTVKKGQLLAEIDPEVFESALAQANARLASSRAGLAKAQAQGTDARLRYDRVAGLGDSGAIARADVDTARSEQSAAAAAVAAARADVTLAKAAVDQARTNLAYTKITSPIDGVVVSRDVDVGQTVAASLQAPTLFVLAEDLRKMELHTNVAESDVGQIATGQPVEFTVDAYPDRTFGGTVQQVRYAAQTVSNVVTYDAVVLVDNAGLELRPGMTANATFVVAERKDVLTIPNAALRYRPAGENPPQGGGRGRGRTIYVLRDGQRQPVQVRLGLSDGGTIEIVEGDVRENDVVILGDGSTPAPQPANQRQGGQRRGQGRGGPPRVF